MTGSVNAAGRMYSWCIRLSRYLSAVVVLAGWSSSPASAQPLPSARSSYEARIAETVRALAESEPRLKRLPLPKRRALIEFVIGNMLFVTAHEVGHGVLAELEIPNPGREEDAADAFAILTALKLGNSFSHRVLVEAAKGWYLADLRDKKTGEKPSYYGEHAMNLQRAYYIICLMVGSDPEKFRELAEIARLPRERQQSCRGDFKTALWSWETLLKPHLRPAEQPRQQVEVIYGEAKGRLEIYARTFRELRFLEPLAEHLVGYLAWPKPFSMEMQTCSEVGANWRSRKLKLCYEMAHDFAELYRDYGDKLKLGKRQREPRSPPSP
jgi:hypothetical protein